jgi:hypothetical protein
MDLFKIGSEKVNVSNYVKVVILAHIILTYLKVITLLKIVVKYSTGERTQCDIK